VLNKHGIYRYAPAKLGCITSSRFTRKKKLDMVAYNIIVYSYNESFQEDD